MTARPRTSRRTHRHARRGFTFLEAVLGVALLGILGGAIFGVLGYAWRVELEARSTLAAAEIANRVLISYIDDPTSPQKLPETIDYEQASYRWAIEIDRTTIRDAFPDARVRPDGSPEIMEALEGMNRVTVTAWLDDGTANAAAPGRTPSFNIERVINPLQYRGTDTLERLLNDPNRLNQFTEQIVGVSGDGQ